MKDIFENFTNFWLIGVHRMKHKGVQAKGVETEPQILHAGRFSVIFDFRKFGDWCSLVSGLNILGSTHHFLIFVCLFVSVNSYMLYVKLFLLGCYFIEKNDCSV